ncbi:MAG: hypothetical protein B7Z37_12300 [Verrucomicrobia bacterium 12-59-8]|nr:MAG: hypothetical protein B7Z37_12300 [Verrucomicrobia bacterium 12-59-8]
MMPTDTLLADLSQLSDLDFAKRRLEPKSPRCIELTLEATGVRTRLPAAVLLHYDTRISRGKRGAARMRNNTCGGCNLALPSGQLADMRHADAELVLCCNCSIYLLPALLDPAAADAPEVAKPAPAAKKVAVKKPRKAKAKAEAPLQAEPEDEQSLQAEADAETSPQSEDLAN